MDKIWIGNSLLALTQLRLKSSLSASIFANSHSCITMNFKFICEVKESPQQKDDLPP